MKLVKGQVETQICIQVVDGVWDVTSSPLIWNKVHRQLRTPVDVRVYQQVLNHVKQET